MSPQVYRALVLSSAVMLMMSAACCSPLEQKNSGLPNPAPAILDANQWAVLSEWMRERANLRLASRADCSCNDDIDFYRRVGPWGQPIPDYDPYTIVGDFNGDAHVDTAAVLVGRYETNPPDGLLVIFNGPVSSSPQPAFVGEVTPFPRQALHMSRSNEYLLIGPFESEACVIRPAGGSYVIDCEGFSGGG